MKAPHRVLLFVLVAVLFFWATGCAVSPSVGEQLTETWNAAVSDGVITTEEAQRIAELLQLQGEQIDWPTTIGTSLASIATSFLGLNIYRNNREKKVWGPPPPTTSPSPASTT